MRQYDWYLLLKNGKESVLIFFSKIHDNIDEVKNKVSWYPVCK